MAGKCSLYNFVRSSIVTLALLAPVMIILMQQNIENHLVAQDESKRYAYQTRMSKNKLTTTDSKAEGFAEFQATSLTRSEERLIRKLVQANSNCNGKEPLLSILVRSGQSAEDLTANDCHVLPTWAEVVDLYGEQPIIFGLDSCARYRRHLQAQKDGILPVPLEFENCTAPPKPQPRVAGLFNTGTNALAQSFWLNIEQLKFNFGSGGDPNKNRTHYDYEEYNVFGGKHVPPKREWYATFNNTAAARWNILPVVLVRDPFRWMQSMCRMRYNAHWAKGMKGHCPNLVPTGQERQQYAGLRNMSTFPVDVSLRKSYFDRYSSLADLWSTWNRLYFDADFPRLMIRFEDTLFHAEEVMHHIKVCVGLPTTKPYRYNLGKSKDKKKGADFTSALAKYGTHKGRFDGLYPEDLAYAQIALDPELLQVFHYSDVSIDPPSAVV